MRGAKTGGSDKIIRHSRSVEVCGGRTQEATTMEEETGRGGGGLAGRKDARPRAGDGRRKGRGEQESEGEERGVRRTWGGDGRRQGARA